MPSKTPKQKSPAITITQSQVDLAIAKIRQRPGLRLENLLIALGINRGEIYRNSVGRRLEAALEKSGHVRLEIGRNRAENRYFPADWTGPSFNPVPPPPCKVWIDPTWIDPEVAAGKAKIKPGMQGMALVSKTRKPRSASK